MNRTLIGLLAVAALLCALLPLVKPRTRSVVTAIPAPSSNLLQHNSRPFQAESVPAALDPWETPIADFFVRSHFGPPRALSEEEQAQWAIVIDGLVEKPVTFTVADLRMLPQISHHAVLQCSGNGRGLQAPRVAGIQWQRGAVGNAAWEGVSLASLLARAKIKPEARFIRLEGADKPAFASVPGFVRSIPIEKGLQQDTILALTMNRQALPLLHGGPVRLILPGWYGENWIKWITHITLTEKEDPGFYMKKGYRVPREPVKPGEAWDSATGVPIERLRVSSLITYPTTDSEVLSGDIEVRGKAFSGERTIKRVDVSLDQGQTWQTAQLDEPRKDGGWQSFRINVELHPNQDYSLMSRATDSDGDTQPLEHDWNPGGYVRNAVDRVTFRSASSPGRNVMTMKCASCHSLELVENQRLTQKQWEGVLKKMASFGVNLTPEENANLTSYLAHYDANRTLLSPSRVSYHDKVAELDSSASSSLHGNKKRGAELFEQKCSMCHGQTGEGNIGPRLMNRGFSQIEFWNTVQQGRGSMPGFKDVLQINDMTDLDSFIRH